MLLDLQGQTLERPDHHALAYLKRTLAGHRLSPPQRTPDLDVAIWSDRLRYDRVGSHKSFDPHVRLVDKRMTHDRVQRQILDDQQHHRRRPQLPARFEICNSARDDDSREQQTGNLKKQIALQCG